MEEKETTMAGGERPSWTAFFLLHHSRPSDFVTDSHNGLFFFSFAFALSQKEEEAL
jgi:hypothetical protein